MVRIRIRIILLMLMWEGGRLRLKEDVLSLLLQTENEYHNTVKNAVKEAEKYVDARRKGQAAFVERLKQDLHLYEKTEAEKLEQALTAENEKMEREAERLKKRMKARQEKKADRISELLKEEVLSLLWR